MKEQALLALQGPEAVEALDALAPGVGELSFMQGGAVRLARQPAWISRSGYTGEDGFEISVPAPRRASGRRRAGRRRAVKPIGLGARDSLRLEAGLPLYGHDLDRDTTPVEADLDFAIASAAAPRAASPARCGSSPSSRTAPPQKRVGLVVEGRQPVREGALILDAEGNEVGRVTSGGFSPILGRPIAMAYVADRAGRAGHRADARAARQDVHRRRSRRCRSSPTAITANREPPHEPLFHQEHEWVRVEGDVATVGITDHAQEALGDIVFAEVPEAGRALTKGDEAAVVESVKAASRRLCAGRRRGDRGQSRRWPTTRR